jgi:hypothetical protein
MPKKQFQSKILGTVIDRLDEGTFTIEEMTQVFSAEPRVMELEVYNQPGRFIRQAEYTLSDGTFDFAFLSEEPKNPFCRLEVSKKVPLKLSQLAGCFEEGRYLPDHTRSDFGHYLETAVLQNLSKRKLRARVGLSGDPAEASTYVVWLTIDLTPSFD